MLVQVYCQTITVENVLNATVEAILRAGSPERWSVIPSSLALQPKQTADIQLHLRVLRFAQKRKAVERGQRDVFHIKASRSGMSHDLVGTQPPSCQQLTAALGNGTCTLLCAGPILRAEIPCHLPAGSASSWSATTEYSRIPRRFAEQVRY